MVMRIYRVGGNIMLDQLDRLQEKLQKATEDTGNDNADIIADLVQEAESLDSTSIPEDFNEEIFLSRFQARNHINLESNPRSILPYFSAWQKIACSFLFVCVLALTVGGVGHAFGINWIDFIHMSQDNEKFKVDVTMSEADGDSNDHHTYSKEQLLEHLKSYAPKWMPKDYHIIQSDYFVSGASINYNYYYGKPGSDVFATLMISEYKTGNYGSSSMYSKDGLYSEEYKKGDLVHYINSDHNSFNAVWNDFNKVYFLSGISTLNEIKQVIDSFYNKELPIPSLEPLLHENELKANLEKKKPDLEDKGLKPVSKSYQILPSKIRYTYSYKDGNEHNLIVNIDEYQGKPVMVRSSEDGSDGQYHETYTINMDTDINIDSTSDGYQAIWTSDNSIYSLTGDIPLVMLEDSILGCFKKAATSNSLLINDQQRQNLLAKYQPTILNDTMKLINSQMDIRNGIITFDYAWSTDKNQLVNLSVTDLTRADDSSNKQEIYSNIYGDKKWQQGDIIYAISSNNVSLKVIQEAKVFLEQINK